jgi:thiamine biosynthesis lipoprotein
MRRHSYAFEALGTHWVVETPEEISPGLKQRLHDRIELFDRTYSRFRDDSLVTEISKQAGTYVFPEDAAKLVAFYEHLYELTDGKVTLLVGDMLSRAGYDAEYSLQPTTQRVLPAWNEAMRWDNGVVTTSEPIILDFGAAGKGYLVDILSTLLDEEGIGEYVIDASGDLRHKGGAENKVGLEHPLHEGKIIGAVDVQNKSVCASASNRRAWGEGMHHIFDPDAMAPTASVIATWVIADEAMIADGLATALFFTEPKQLRRQYAFDFLRMFADGSVEYSPYFEGKLF